MQYPIIDTIVEAYQRNGWTGLDIIEGKNLATINSFNNIGWANDLNATYPNLINQLNNLENGFYTVSFDFEIIEVNDRYTSNTATATCGKVMIFSPGTYTFTGYNITRQQALNGYSNHSTLTFEKTGNFNHFYLYGLGRDSAAVGAPNGVLGTANISNFMIERGQVETSYEPYHAPTTDIYNRLKLPLPHYFPHPVIDALQRAAAGTQTADDIEILQHYLTPLGIGGI